jgi:hypothetical protein
MNQLLNKARGLYIDRQRIALAGFLIMFTSILFLFYSNGIDSIVEPPIDWEPTGWSQGITVIASFNTVGFFLTFSVMVFFYAFWHWAFMPGPAATYTTSVLHGVFGYDVKIVQLLGKRFRIYLSEAEFIDVRCRIKEQGSGEWFVYQLKSPIVQSTNSKEIALRHGMSLKENRFTTWVTHDELHHRTFLLAKAIAIANKQ